MPRRTNSAWAPAVSDRSEAGCAGSLSPPGTAAPRDEFLGSGGARSLAESGEVELHARAHRGADGDLLYIGPLHAGWLGLGDGVIEGAHILDDGALGKAQLADPGMHQPRLLRPILHLAGLGLLDGLGDIHGHGAELRVGHQPTRA